MCATLHRKLRRMLHRVTSPPPGSWYARQVGRTKKIIKSATDIKLSSLSAEIAFYIVFSFFPFLIFSSNVILLGGILNATLYDFTRPPPNEKMNQ